MVSLLTIQIPKVFWQCLVIRKTIFRYLKRSAAHSEMSLEHMVAVRWYSFVHALSQEYQLLKVCCNEVAETQLHFANNQSISSGSCWRMWFHFPVHPLIFADCLVENLEDSLKTGDFIENFM